jgi:hypothetical protein
MIVIVRNTNWSPDYKRKEERGSAVPNYGCRWMGRSSRKMDVRRWLLRHPHYSLGTPIQRRTLDRLCQTSCADHRRAAPGPREPQNALPCHGAPPARPSNWYVSICNDVAVKRDVDQHECDRLTKAGFGKSRQGRTRGPLEWPRRIARAVVWKYDGLRSRCGETRRGLRARTSRSISKLALRRSADQTASSVRYKGTCRRTFVVSPRIAVGPRHQFLVYPREQAGGRISKAIAKRLRLCRVDLGVSSTGGIDFARRTKAFAFRGCIRSNHIRQIRKWVAG